MYIKLIYKKHEFEIDERSEATSIKYHIEIVIKAIGDIIKAVNLEESK